MRTRVPDDRPAPAAGARNRRMPNSGDYHSPWKGHPRMSAIRFRKTTTATPEQFIAALTDFGPGRSAIFPNSSDDSLKVHDVGADHADVTEGSSGIWERLHYDWSDPRRVVLTTVDSNLWGGASGHTYTVTPRPDGRTDIDVVVIREGKNLKGRALAVVVGIIGKRYLGKAFDTTITAVEARTPGSTPPGHA